MKHNFNFYTEYHQFYLVDKLNQSSTGSDNFWTDESHNAKLAIENGILGIGTHCYGNIKGEIEVLDKPPIENINYELYDHIVEGGIKIQSGELQILDCPNNHLELSVQLSAGKYRVRVYGSNFDSVKGKLILAQWYR